MPGFEVFGEEERQAINDLFLNNGGILFAHGFDGLRKGIYKVREFESSFAAKFETQYAQAVSSGSAALRVALAALNVGPGDEVIVPSFTFVATAEAVIQSGADLVIVDIDDTFTMCPHALESAITKKSKVIIPVHMMGAPANMEKILSLANTYGLRVIEDACQCTGGTYKGKYVGTISDIGCFSFDAGKVMITGEGGMIVTEQKNLFVRARAYHDHGHEYSTEVARGAEGAIGEGFNYRMTEMQGAIGIVQLNKLDHIITMQRANKLKLKSFLIQNNFPFQFRRILDEGEIGDSLIFRLPNRKQTDIFLQKMKNRGLVTKNIPDAVRWHFSKYWTHIFQKYGWYTQTYKSQWLRSADIMETAIALPIMVKMSDDQIEETGQKIISIAKEVAGC